MPRINVEDSLFKDTRFYKLAAKAGRLQSALGELVYSWVVAQETWLAYGKKGIPLSIWKERDMSNDIIDCGLAKVVDDYVIVSGCEKAFEWLERCQKQGKTHGKGRNIEIIKEPCLTNQTNDNDCLTSSSSSCSSSNTKNNTVATTEKSVAAPSVTFDFESGSFIGITDKMIQTWSEAYPAVDVRLEIKKAALWQKTNPHKRKKKYDKFLTAWISRTQERGGSRDYYKKEPDYPQSIPYSEVENRPFVKMEPLTGGKR